MAGRLVLIVAGTAATESLASELRSKGHHIFSVRDVAQALHLMESLLPSLIVLHVRTPDEVREVAQALREQEVPIPFVLESESSDVHIWADQFGAIGFMYRPALGK